MFNLLKKEFYGFLIPVSVLINLPFFSFSEKVNAQNIKLTCDMKTHVKRWVNDYWEDLENRTWTLEIDYENNIKRD